MVRADKLHPILAPTDDEIRRTAEQVATALGETRPERIRQIARFHRDQDLELVQEIWCGVSDILARGGVPVPDGCSRNIAGEEFFRLAFG